MGFPVGSVVKNPSASAEDMGLILGQEDPLEEKMASEKLATIQQQHDKVADFSQSDCSNRKQGRVPQGLLLPWVSIRSYSFFSVIPGWLYQSTLMKVGRDYTRSWMQCQEVRISGNHLDVGYQSAFWLPVIHPLPSTCKIKYPILFLLMPLSDYNVS